jgi:hypothetical protein
MALAIESISQLGLTFFGLTSDIAPQVRASLFSQIHQIVFHGNGGYDWHTIYDMPIWLRRFTFNEIKRHYDEEKSAIENKTSKGTKTAIGSDGTVKTPELLQKVNSNKNKTFTPPPKRPVTYK